MRLVNFRCWNMAIIGVDLRKKPWKSKKTAVNSTLHTYFAKNTRHCKCFLAFRLLKFGKKEALESHARFTLFICSGFRKRFYANFPYFIAKGQFENEFKTSALYKWILFSMRQLVPLKTGSGKYSGKLIDLRVIICLLLFSSGFPKIARI